MNETTVMHSAQNIAGGGNKTMFENGRKLTDFQQKSEESSNVQCSTILVNGYEVPASCSTEVLKLAKDNAHLRDKFIVFDEEPHKYYVKGISKGWTSVTSVVHEFFPEFDAEAAATRIVGLPGFKTDEKYAKYQHLLFDKDGVQPSENDVKSRIVKYWKSKGELAAKLGTKLHRSIELFFNQEEVENESEEYLKHFNEFCKAHAHLEPYRTEWMVYSEEDMVCGSIDIVMRDKFSGELVIIDWKRVTKLSTNGYGKKGLGPLAHLDDTNFVHYSLQLNLYRYILETYYNVKISGGLRLVVLHPSNPTFQVYDAWDLQDEIKTILKTKKEG